MVVKGECNGSNSTTIGFSDYPYYFTISLIIVQQYARSAKAKESTEEKS
jgi:hypothetical protein